MKSIALRQYSIAHKQLCMCLRYHHGGRWGDYFPFVVGIVHTDYLQYSRAEPEYAEAKAKVRTVLIVDNKKIFNVQQLAKPGKIDPTFHSLIHH